MLLSLKETLVVSAVQMPDVHDIEVAHLELSLWVCVHVGTVEYNSGKLFLGTYFPEQCCP